ncbi:hypothetical protein GT037_005589 [Alternaria burnsii]|uniref:Uncharacterized protein n=1 Tax=Alternaria burnsii TaxID=1187904 RepID=A0A8H7EDT1_9PLEO|nr:uncharacterized protein GT037_005589 [Alternaria burnsii]KAF7676084.1 hypothetical protein GT037_005589 [Alternaria burnsii]
MSPKATSKQRKRKKRDHSSEDDERHHVKGRKTKTPKVNPPKAQSQCLKAPKLPRGLRGPKGTKLKQVQYHKFEYDVVIYHYAASFISVSDFRSLLTRQQHGYVNYLLGPDPLASKPDPSGDELLPGCLEVGYLPSVFVLGGSALGFRLDSHPPTIEWLCFDRDVKDSILELLDINTHAQRMLFEHVASLQRAPAPEKKWDRRLAYTEHKDWYESLKEAGRRPFRLGLTWRRWGTEMMIEGMKKRDEETRSEEGRAMTEGVATMDMEDDYADAEEDDERGGEEDRDTGISYERGSNGPKAIGGRSLFVYRDSIPNQNVTPQRSSRSDRSPSSLQPPALGNRSTNTRQTQPPSSKERSRKKDNC